MTSDARLTGRIGGLTAWATVAPERMLAPAWRGQQRRYERIASEAAERDGRTLTPDELAANAERAKRAHMLLLAVKSAAVRRERAAHRKAAAVLSTTAAAGEVRGAPRRPRSTR